MKKEISLAAGFIQDRKPSKPSNLMLFNVAVSIGTVGGAVLKRNKVRLPLLNLSNLTY